MKLWRKGQVPGPEKKVWPEARAQDVGWVWAQNVGITGEYTVTKYCGKVECEHCVGTQTKVGVKVFLIVNLSPPPPEHRLHWSTSAPETYSTPKIPSPHPSHGPQVEATPVWRLFLVGHLVPPAGYADW